MCIFSHLMSIRSFSDLKLIAIDLSVNNAQNVTDTNPIIDLLNVARTG